MKSLTLIALIILIFFSFSCEKKRNDLIKLDSSNTFQIKDFEIFESIADTLLVSNVALTSSSVTFKASEKYDSVNWTIGNDERVFKEKQVSLIFENPELIKITLIGFINSAYHFSGRKIDTVVKQVEIRNARNSFIVGRYKGIRTSNPSDTFTIEIKQVNDLTWYNEYFIYNFPNGCTVWSPPYPMNTGYLISAGAKHFRIRNDLPAIRECLFEVSGVGSLKNNDSLILDFKFREMQNEPQLTTDKFIGKKL